jgi:diguanylate cyclase (GGDEF)-like protein
MLAIGFGHSSTTSAMAQGGLLVVMSFGTLILRVSLPFVAAINMILFCEDAVFLHWDRYLNSGEKVSATLLVGTFALLSILANYRTEGLERRQFLLFLKEDQRSRKYALLSRDLADISKRDGLTGLYNRRHFDDYLRIVWEAARLDATPVSIIMIDIDTFKDLNDSFGHLFGDQVLTSVADMLRASIRGREDAVARFGGDEFVIILPEMDRDQARETAERLCERARKVALFSPTSGVLLPLTVSCGVSSALPADLPDPTELLAQADRELYRAKALGRNRACCAPKPFTAERPQ